MHLFFATGVPRFTSNRRRIQPSGTDTGLADPSSTTTLTAPSGSLSSISWMVLDKKSGRLNVVIATPIFGCSSGVANQGALAEDSRSEEHTSELQSRENLVCRLLLEKKKIRKKTI